MLIDGVEHGTAVVDANNQRERLFTLTEPYDFRGGELVRLFTPEESPDEHNPTDRGPVREMTPYYSQWEKGGESYRIECAALFAELPPENDLPCGFMHVHAEPVFAETDNDESIAASPSSARLTWVTTWDARCRVEYWVQIPDRRTIPGKPRGKSPGHSERPRSRHNLLLPDQRLRKGSRSCRVHGQHLRDIPTDASGRQGRIGATLLDR